MIFSRRAALLRLLLTITLAAAPRACISGSESAEFVETSELQDGLPVYWLAQTFDGHSIVLDANNGFFDKGAYRAIGEYPAPDWDKELIKAHFKHLIPSANADGAARWYVETTTPGQVIATINSMPSTKQAPGTWTIEMADQRHQVAADKPIGQCRFDVKSAGKQTFALSYRGANPPRLSSIELKGSAIKNARLLRARWRPAAIHTQYSSSTCPQTRMWVFESQSLVRISSYSPVSTQFGYFGGSFNDNQVASGNLNFSVWAASRGANQAPPLSRMPHLIATGNPKAEFGGFGHEGSGVKIRNWEPLSHHPRSIIQALRVETTGDTDTFSGYFYDERIQRWILFAQARRPAKYSRSRKQGEPAHLRATSFCEIPGPPAVERTGDRRRVIRRRGWFWGDDSKWHRVDTQTTKADKPANRSISADDGWFLMATGGMEMVKSNPVVTIPESNQLPEYLSTSKTAQLFMTPVEFGNAKATALETGSASIDYEIRKSGTNAIGVLHFGTQDCLTFVSRELHATERKGVSSDMLSRDRTWAHATDGVKLKNGANRFDLTKLKPQTQYHYRLLVTNDEGKNWDTKSGTFTTR